MMSSSRRIVELVKPDAELKRAIKGLYRTFARYPLPTRIDACPCCVSAADHARLASKGLRDLGPNELSRYAFKAMTTWGGTDDFRHFLPRIFELISADGGVWTIPQAVFGKLAYGDWQAWPADERAAIETFFQALWSNVLDHFPHVFSADVCLACIARAGRDDMMRYLNRWRIAQSLTHAKHFAAFVERNPFFSPSDGWSLDVPYWEDHQVLARQVADRLCDPARKSELEQAFFHLATDAEEAALLSDAIDYIARFFRH